MLSWKERYTFFMRKNAIIKMVVSAAAAAYVAVMPVQAEENGEDEIEYTESGYEAGAVSEEAVDGSDGEGKSPKVQGAGEDDNAQGGAGYGTGTCQTDEEAQYVAMGQLMEGRIQESLTGQPELEELIKKTGYGPHLLLYMKELEQTEEAKTEPEPAPYTEEDLYILAHAICGEGQGYPDEEQLYIGSVILNRRAHGAYPNTIKEVVFQRGQYACTRDGNYYREPTPANWRNAKWLLENGSILPASVVYQAGFRQGSGLYAQTRYHKYCYR